MILAGDKIAAGPTYLLSAAGLEAALLAGAAESVLEAGLESGFASGLDSEPSELFDVPLRA